MKAQNNHSDLQKKSAPDLKKSSKTTQFKKLLQNLSNKEQIQHLKPASPVQSLVQTRVQREESESSPETTSTDIKTSAASGLQGSSQPLPYLEQIQQSFGVHDVSSIQCHIGPEATKSNEEMGAMAFAAGEHIAFKSQPDLHTTAHEAAHVVQQRSGVNLKDGVGQAGDQYEQNADAVADRVVQGKSAEDLMGNPGQEQESQSGADRVQQKSFGEAVEDSQEYYVIVSDATIRRNNNPKRFTGKSLPKGIKVKRVRAFNNISQIEVTSLEGKKGVKVGNKYWTTTKNLGTEKPKPKLFGEAVSDPKIYVIAAPDATIRNEEDPNKFTKDSTPQGIKVKCLRIYGKASQVEITSLEGKEGTVGNKYWTSTGNLGTIEDVKDATIYWMTKTVATNDTPFRKKGKGPKLNKEQTCTVVKKASSKKYGSFYYLKSEDGKKDYKWVNIKFVLKAPKDRSDNFDWMEKVEGWDGTQDSVTPENMERIKKNRAGVNDRTDKETYKKRLRKAKKGYIYSDSSKDTKVTIEGDTAIEKTVNGIIFNELMKEGSWASINSYDGEIFTWGRGFAATGQLGLVFKELFKINPKYRKQFQQVGIDIINGKLHVLDSDGKLHVDKSKKKGMDASKVIRSNAQLQSFFIELAEKKDFKDDIAQAQYRVVMNNAGKWPPYIIDKKNGKFKGKWDKATIAMICHLSHWLPAGSWKYVSYESTNGDMVSVIYRYIQKTGARAPGIGKKYDHNVFAWKSSLPVMKKLSHFGIPRGDARTKFDATWGSSFSKALEFKASSGSKKEAFLKGTDQYLKDCIILPEGGDKYRIVTSLADKALANHLVKKS